MKHNSIFHLGGSSQLLQHPPELHYVILQMEEVCSEEQTFIYMLQKPQNNHHLYIHNVLHFSDKLNHILCMTHADQVRLHHQGPQTT